MTWTSAMCILLIKKNMVSNLKLVLPVFLWFYLNYEPRYCYHYAIQRLIAGHLLEFAPWFSLRFAAQFTFYHPERTSKLKERNTNPVK